MVLLDAFHNSEATKKKATCARLRHSKLIVVLFSRSYVSGLPNYWCNWCKMVWKHQSKSSSSSPSTVIRLMRPPFLITIVHSIERYTFYTSEWAWLRFIGYSKHCLGNSFHKASDSLDSGSDIFLEYERMVRSFNFDSFNLINLKMFSAKERGHIYIYITNKFILFDTSKEESPCSTGGSSEDWGTILWHNILLLGQERIATTILEHNSQWYFFEKDRTRLSFTHKTLWRCNPSKYSIAPQIHQVAKKETKKKHILVKAILKRLKRRLRFYSKSPGFYWHCLPIFFVD